MLFCLLKKTEICFKCLFSNIYSSNVVSWARANSLVPCRIVDPFMEFKETRSLVQGISKSFFHIPIPMEANREADLVVGLSSRIIVTSSGILSSCQPSI